MKKFLLFLLTSLALQAAAIDPRNECYLTIFQSLQFKGNRAEIETSKGTFIWAPQPFEKKMLNHWKRGDTLTLVMDEERPKLLLRNKESDIFYLPEVAFKELPTITSVELREDEVTFTLSDGSTWASDDKDEMNFWQLGDSVIVAPREGAEVEMTDVDFIKEGRGEHWPIDARRI